MGEMFTVPKVRDNLTSYDGDAGWYDNPRGPSPGRRTFPCCITPVANAKAKPIRTSSIVTQV